MRDLPPPSIDLGPDEPSRHRTRVRRGQGVRPLRSAPGRNGSVALCEVASESKPDTWYVVYEEPDASLFCACPDFVFRKRHRGLPCKHLIGIQAQGLVDTAHAAAKERAAADLSLPRFLILDLS